MPVGVFECLGVLIPKRHMNVNMRVHMIVYVYAYLLAVNAYVSICGHSYVYKCVLASLSRDAPSFCPPSLAALR